MFGAAVIIAAAVLSAYAASFVLWRATNRSGLCALLTGVVLAIVVLGLAVLIGVVMTRAWLPH